MQAGGVRDRPAAVETLRSANRSSGDVRFVSALRASGSHDGCRQRCAPAATDRSYNCIWRIRAHAHCGEVIERCPNSEIRTHIFENRVLQLVRDVLRNPDKLRLCIEVPADNECAERKKLGRRLTTFDKRMREIEAERRRIINLYATGKLDKDASPDSTTSSRLYSATRRRWGATQGLNKRTEIDVRIRGDLAIRLSTERYRGASPYHGRRAGPSHRRGWAGVNGRHVNGLRQTPRWRPSVIVVMIVPLDRIMTTQANRFDSNRESPKSRESFSRSP
jgi:hypothetical protein